MGSAKMSWGVLCPPDALPLWLEPLVGVADLLARREPEGKREEGMIEVEGKSFLHHMGFPVDLDNSTRNQNILKRYM